MLTRADILAGISNLSRTRCRGGGEFTDGSGEFSQNEVGAERVMKERVILAASLLKFIHVLSFSTARSAGVDYER